MDHARNLLASAPIALVLVILSFFAFSGQSMVQFQGIQQPLSATEHGFPLPFQYVNNCDLPAQMTFCSTATPPLNAIIPLNPSKIVFVSAAIDYLFWFAISFLVVTLFDALTMKRFSSQGETKNLVTSAGTT